jgi:hypothetical protein
LGQLVAKKTLMDYYQISESSYYQIMNGNGGALVLQKYVINVQRSRVLQVQKDEIIQILDDILPFQSERTYRYQKETNDYIYQKI